MRHSGRFQRFPSAMLLASNVGRAGSQWVLVWMYALIGGSSTVGAYTLGLALATPVFIVCEMSLRNVYVTLNIPIAFRTYVLVRTLACALALLLLLGLTTLGIASFTILVLIGLIKTADSFLDISYGALQKRGRIMTIALSSLLNSSVTVIVGAVFYWLTQSVELSLVGSLIGSVLTAAAVFFPVLRKERALPTSAVLGRPAIKSVLRAGFPSGLAYALISLLTYLPIYFLGVASGKDQVGVFSVLAYFLTFANLFYNSVQQSTLHSFVLHFAQGGIDALRKYTMRLVLPLVACGVLSSVLVLVFGDPFISSVYGPEFSLSFQEIWPIAVSLALLPLIYLPGAVLLTRNRYDTQFAIGLVALVASTACGFALFDHFDLATASMLVLIGTGCRAFLGVASLGRTFWRRTSLEPLSI